MEKKALKDNGLKACESCSYWYDDGFCMQHCYYTEGAYYCPKWTDKAIDFDYDSNDYLKNIASGNYDIEGYPIKGIALAEYVKSINNKDKQGFVYTYPNRLQAHFINENGLINQIEVVVKRLSENLGTNRAVMILYDPDVDSYEEDDPEKLVKDIPCLNFIQVLVKDDILNLHVKFRSNDIFTAYPSNMMFITYLGMIITEKLNEEYPTIKFGGIYYNCTSAHYYTDVVNDEMIEKIL